MNIVVTGLKGSGKSTVGKALSDLLGLPLIETDRTLEQRYADETSEGLSCRQIFAKNGEETFRRYEREATQSLGETDWHIIVTGGGTFLDPASRAALRENALIVMFTADPETLWERATEAGLPPWLEGPDGQETFNQQLTLRSEVITPFADAVIDTATGTPEELAKQASSAIEREIAVRCRRANTFGDIIRMTSFGESHGKAIGCILEGIRPGFDMSNAIIQKEMDRRKPGQSKVVTQRKEPDTVEILSGVFEGKTTGAPIGLIVYNRDQDSSKYEEIRHLFRPGHADFTFYQKYAHRDHRGGGRSSGRETATRVAAGAVAMEVLNQHGITIHAHAVEVAGIEAKTCDYDAIESNPVRCADPKAAKKMEKAILDARKNADSVGGIIQLDILGVPPGIGDPVFAKLDARLTTAIMTIGAIKGVEIGRGFALTRLKGSESNDAMVNGDFETNNGGGITGGISTGQTIYLRVAVKPTASVAQSQQTINLDGENESIVVGGRHDPCIVPRAVPVIEHMAALVLLDAWEIQARLRPDWESS